MAPSLFFFCPRGRRAVLNRTPTISSSPAGLPLLPVLYPFFGFCIPFHLSLFSVLAAAPHSSRECGFMTLDVGFGNILARLGPWLLHINVRITLSVSTRAQHWNVHRTSDSVEQDLTSLNIETSSPYLGNAFLSISVFQERCVIFLL